MDRWRRVSNAVLYMARASVRLLRTCTTPGSVGLTRGSLACLAKVSSKMSAPGSTRSKSERNHFPKKVSQGGRARTTGGKTKRCLAVRLHTPNLLALGGTRPQSDPPGRSANKNPKRTNDAVQSRTNGCHPAACVPRHGGAGHLEEEAVTCAMETHDNVLGAEGERGETATAPLTLIIIYLNRTVSLLVKITGSHSHDECVAHWIVQAVSKSALER